MAAALRPVPGSAFRPDPKFFVEEATALSQRIRDLTTRTLTPQALQACEQSLARLVAMNSDSVKARASLKLFHSKLCDVLCAKKEQALLRYYHSQSHYSPSLGKLKTPPLFLSMHVLDSCLANQNSKPEQITLTAKALYQEVIAKGLENNPAAAFPRLKLKEANPVPLGPESTLFKDLLMGMNKHLQTKKLPQGGLLLKLGDQVVAVVMQNNQNHSSILIFEEHKGLFTYFDDLKTATCFLNNNLFYLPPFPGQPVNSLEVYSAFHQDVKPLQQAAQQEEEKQVILIEEAAPVPAQAAFSLPAFKILELVATAAKQDDKHAIERHLASLRREDGECSRVFLATARALFARQDHPPLAKSSLYRTDAQLLRLYGHDIVNQAAEQTKLKMEQHHQAWMKKTEKERAAKERARSQHAERALQPREPSASERKQQAQQQVKLAKRDQMAAAAHRRMELKLGFPETVAKYRQYREELIAKTQQLMTLAESLMMKSKQEQ
jgi:hypothetical protein